MFVAASVFGRRVVAVKPFAAGNYTRLLHLPTPIAAFSFTTNRPNVLLSSSAAATTIPHYPQCTSSFSTNSSTSANNHPPKTTNNAKNNSSSSNTGIIAKFKRMIRTLFGTEDDTPRGIQERKEMYWIVLLVAHQRLRVENQQNHIITQQQHQHPTNNSHATGGGEEWEMESKEQLKQLMNDAVHYLDTKTDITQMSLKRLRNEVQSYLTPQIIHLLTVAQYADVAINKKEDKVSNTNTNNNEDEDDYIFTTNEEVMYKEILLHEYNHTCQLLQQLHDSSSVTKDGSNNNSSSSSNNNNNDDDNNSNSQEKITASNSRTPNPRPFYIMKKDAIETLLKHYNWWSIDNENHSNNANENVDDIEYIDPFGFVPNKATKDVVCAMRYYQTRNLVRAFMVRNTHYYHPHDEKSSNTTTTQIHQPPPPKCYHTLLALKSTITTAGRGVYIDGFAPAGTLLAFIPGNVWTKEQLSNITTQTQIQLSNDPKHQLSMRYDDILIDSRHAPYTVVSNLWSLGHIVNHPPPPSSLSHASSLETLSNCNNNKEDNDDDKSQTTKTTMTTFHGPNCATVMINFTERMFESNVNNNNDNDSSSKKVLHTYLPNMYEHPSTVTPYTKNIFETENVIMHSMGLIAIRDVKDEELFYDYRLCPSSSSLDNNNNGYPSWYHVWDEDALKKRWDTDE
jgi:hypothetical protein